jgi:DNA recombination protein RmuC
LNAYLDACSAKEEAPRKAALERHAQQVWRHVEHLASKQYWSQFEAAPDLVVLFLPGDHFFSAALECQPTLIEDALERRVLIATPVTLISVLKGIGYAWRQELLAENAEQIRHLAAEFFDRLSLFAQHYGEAGKQLARAVDAYNRSVGSWESRLQPAVRRLKDLGATSTEEAPELEPIDTQPRVLRSGEITIRSNPKSPATNPRSGSLFEQ